MFQCHSPKTPQQFSNMWYHVITLLVLLVYFFLLIFLNLILFFNFTILHWFCHISTWICHRYTRVPHPEPSSLLPPCTIPLGRPSAPAPSIQYHTSNLDWWLVSYMIFYMFQCHSPKTPQQPNRKKKGQKPFTLTPFLQGLPTGCKAGRLCLAIHTTA